MRTASSKYWGMRLGLTLWLVGGAFCTIWAADSATNIPTARVLSSSTNAPLSADGKRLLFSSGVGDIVKLLRAGMDASVIKAFIAHSRVSYHLTAQEIVFLKKLGLADDILIALLMHQPAQAAHPSPSRPIGPGSGAPPPNATPAEAGLPGYALASRYGMSPYAWPPMFAPSWPGFNAFGPVVSFNNSFPTFVNGQAVYAGQYVPTYRVLW